MTAHLYVPMMYSIVGVTAVVVTIVVVVIVERERERKIEEKLEVQVVMRKID